MTFAQIPPGSAVFLDANILVYHLTAHALLGSACTVLVRQIEQNTLTGFTATHVLSEVAQSTAKESAGWTRNSWRLIAFSGERKHA